VLKALRERLALPARMELAAQRVPQVLALPALLARRAQLAWVLPAPLGLAVR
jgi:hypothetical protein